MYEERIKELIKQVRDYEPCIIDPKSNCKLSSFTYSSIMDLEDWLSDDDEYEVDESYTGKHQMDILEKIIKFEDLHQLVSRTRYTLDKKFLKEIVELLCHWVEDIKLKNTIDNLLKDDM